MSATLEILLSDLAAQSVLNFDVTVVDSLSSDNTLDILEKYSRKLDLNYISEDDAGIYYGLNKAIRLCNGTHCLCLGADDRIIDSDFVAKLIDSNLNPDILYYTDIWIKQKSLVRKKFYKDYYDFKCCYGGLAHFHHQTALIPLAFLSKTEYDTRFQTYSDLDLMFRAQANMHCKKLDICGVLFSSSGVSGSFKSVFRRLTEIMKIRRSNGLSTLNMRVIFSLLRQLL